jgi:hypothetical protein
VPSIALSLCLGVLMGGITEFVGMAGFAYIFITPFFHLMIYDLTNPKEYYFYHNLGVSRLMLWLNTCVISLIIGILSMVI